MIQAKEIKLVKLKDIKLNPNNRNKHPDEQIDRIVDIIKYQGFRRPGTISNRSGLLVCGEGRYLAAKKLGLKEMPIMFQDYESEEQEYADGIADNALDKWAELDIGGINEDLLNLSDDFDIELLGLKDFEPVIPEEFEPQSDEDEVPEQVDTRCKLGDVWQLGRHRLMCGDSTSIDAVEKLMDGDKADMVFTDPPYGISIVKGSVGGSKSFGSVGGGKIVKANAYAPIIGDDTTQTAVDVYNLCVGLKIPTMIFWGGNYYASALPDSSCWIVWDKENTGNFADAELAWTNQNTAVRIFKHMWNGMIKASERGSKRVHPTQKPIALAEWAFNEDKDPKSVLDLFGGSGSTLIACEKTNRKCFMMELDPHYCDVILSRWEKYTGKTAERIDG